MTRPRTEPPEWAKSEHVDWYRSWASEFPRLREADAALIEHLPVQFGHVLDLGTGDGRLLAVLRAAQPSFDAVGLDVSSPMLEAAAERLAGDVRTELVRHNLAEPLPDLGSFDLVVSALAIHHCEDARKRALYGEIFGLLAAGGVFLNLEHVSSPTARLHRAFLDAVGVRPEGEDPSNRLLDVETQLSWLRELGFHDVDCHWKWREFALLGGVKPSG